MCPFCWLSPACPCGRRGGSLFIATTLAALARRVRERLLVRKTQEIRDA